jgi:tetratricopeptide (TPR) repeat protein
VLRNQQGRDAEAVAYYREALELEKRYLPPDHQDTLATEHNLAQQMAHHHQAAAAEPLFRELLATSLRLLGPDHDNTVNDRLGLAEDLTQQKRYHEAAAEALAALEAINRVAKDEERWAAYGWRYYGMAACLDGQSEAGLTALRRAQELEARQLSATDVHRLYTNVSLGRCLVALQRYAEAEPLLLESVPALVAASSTRSDRTQDGYRALRDLYAATGRTAEAAQWQSKLLPDD